MTCVQQTIDSPLGPLVTVAGPDGLCLLEFAEPDRLDAQVAAVRRWFQSDVVPGSNPHLDHLRRELDAYFAGSLTRFTVPVVIPGTTFQERVWAELRRIPYGETRSYEEVARAVGARSASRAVGRANGSNRIAIVVPCHRVVNKDGGLGGYGGQLWRKQALLRLERPFGLR
jgi:AraC family transcriptional regulator, regulatory protein of adaptative response / methylated-DNA-[protein]-cysteine methyltransferase